ncbi:MAG TPA: hypothetical protein VFW90_03660, partial [Candidatus Saccharimonadales bacterium]|nr:hypothetical protein [Candidatus Saccharimonadales bacterium]
MKTDQGFTVIEGLLILVIIAILGGTGWYVWHGKQQADKSLSSAHNQSLVANAVRKPANSTKVKNTYAGWKEYCSDEQGSC